MDTPSTTTPPPIHQHTFPGWQAHAYGLLPSLRHPEGREQAQRLATAASKRALSHVLLITPPAPRFNDSDQLLDDRIVVIDSPIAADVAARERPIVADALVMRAPLPIGLAMDGRDCPRVVLYDRETGGVGLVHAGRDEVRPKRGRGHNLLVGAVLALRDGRHYERRPWLHAYLSTGISAPYFSHEHNPALMRPFFDRYGWDVFTPERNARYALSLHQVITQILKGLGVPVTNITLDGLCTYSDARLGSYRAEKAGIPNKTKSNFTVVVPSP